MVAPFDITKPICTKDGRKASVFNKISALRTELPPIYIIKTEQTDSTGRKFTLMRSYKMNGVPVLGDSSSKDALVNIQPWHRWLIAMVDETRRKKVG